MPVIVSTAERPGVAHCLTPPTQEELCGHGGEFKALGWEGDPELQGRASLQSQCSSGRQAGKQGS